MRKILTAFLATLCIAVNAQKYEGLALTPPMGWNSWYTFQTNMDEKLVMEMADAIVSTGLRAAGYRYLIIDDGWMALERDNAGNLVADPNKFPRGLKMVADYVHSKGLKFGLCNSAGTKSCSGYPGTRGYEFQDARLYASWEIDYLKYDFCNTEGINAKEAYTTMSKALRAAGRPVIFSIAEAGNSAPWQWARDIGHLWRTTADIASCFDCIHQNGTTTLGAIQILDRQQQLSSYAGPAHWNNPGILQVGNGMTNVEERAHFVLWCMSAAPLLAGHDLRRMTKETLALLKNKDLIAIDQDSLGIQGFKYKEQDSLQTWFKPLKGGDWAVCFFNRSSTNRKLQFNWRKELVADTASKRIFNASKTTYRVRNVFNKRSAANTNKPLKATLTAHDVIVFRLKH